MWETSRTKLFSAIAGILFFVLILGAYPLFAQTVVVTTSLTGALARAAGATDVRVLTPPDVLHPPEYELRPSDLTKLDGARVVVYAGYERMVRRLVDTSRSKDVTVIQVDTTTTPDNLVNQARKIALALHTEGTEKAWERGFLKKLAGLKERLAPISGKKAIVHFQAQGFAGWAGLSIVQVIMPGEISAKAVADSVAKRPDIVVDIVHMPVAKVIADNTKCPYAELINFPGVDRTATLEDIFEYNTAQVLKALQR